MARLKYSIRFLGCHGFFFFTKLVYGSVSKHIRLKTKQRRAIHGIGIIAVFINNDLKIRDHTVTVFLDQLYQPIDNVIDLCVLIPAGLKHILDLHRISQFIFRQYIAIPVQDPSSGTGYIPGLLDLKDKVVQILFSVYDLQVETAVKQNTGKKSKQYHKYCQSAGHNINNVISNFTKQISVRSFFPSPPVSD